MKQIIRIVSPAKAIEAHHIDYAVTLLEQSGFTVELGKYVTGRHHYFSGTDKERLDDFQDAINTEHVDIILCARGGYGSIRIVDDLDYTPLKTSPKLIIGFSDITVFHHHVNKHFNLPTVHATMPLNFADNTSESIDSLTKAMKGKTNAYSLTTNPENITGSAEGILIGGNLSIIYALIGTNSDIDFTNKILFIEEVGEYNYTIDRMLWALDKADKLSKLKGLIVGGMTNIRDTETGFGKTIETLILERVSRYNYPVCFNFPSGHINDNRALVLGRKALLTITQEEVTLIN